MIISFIYKTLFVTPQAHSIFDPISINAQVKLTDIDSNIHLTNSRYLYYLDLGRLECMFQIGFFRSFIKTKIRLVVGAVNVTFVRELKPFQKFRIETTLLGWDEKYLYFNQDMLVGETTHATAFSRICPLQYGKKLSPEKMLANLDIDEKQAILPQSVLDWKNGLSNRRNGL